MFKACSTLLTTSIILAMATVPIACTPNLRGEPAVNPDQQETQWQGIGQLPTPLESHQMLILGEFVYVIGGWNESKGIHQSVWFTPFTADDNLDNWQETTATLPLKLQHHVALVYDGALYVFGGDNGFWDGSEVSDQILRAVPNPEGDITDWSVVGQLPEPLTIQGVARQGDRLYVVGGSNTFRPGDTTVINQVFTAAIAADGTVGQFEELAPFPTPIGWVTTTVVDNRLFAISGKTQFSPTRLSDQVWMADILPDQTLSPFVAAGTIMARQRHATVLVDNTLIAIAGGGTNQVLAAVEAADVDAQGNLGHWRSLPALPATRYAHAAFVHGGYIYVSGGFVAYGSNETSRQIFRLRWPHE